MTNKFKNGGKQNNKKEPEKKDFLLCHFWKNFFFRMFIGLKYKNREKKERIYGRKTKYRDKRNIFRFGITTNAQDHGQTKTLMGSRQSR